MLQFRSVLSRPRLLAGPRHPNPCARPISASAQAFVANRVGLNRPVLPRIRTRPQLPPARRATTPAGLSSSRKSWGLLEPPSCRMRSCLEDVARACCVSRRAPQISMRLWHTTTAIGLFGYAATETRFRCLTRPPRVLVSFFRIGKRIGGPAFASVPCRAPRSISRSTHSSSVEGRARS